MEDRDTKGDIYEYMLGKIATAGQNGQFRTPRHIIQLMVEMTAPTPTDVICDPACGTGGFLVAAGEHVRRTFPGARDPKLNAALPPRHVQRVRLRQHDAPHRHMNMLLHGVEQPDIRYRDSLSEDPAGPERGPTRWCSPTRRSLVSSTTRTAQDLLRW